MGRPAEGYPWSWSVYRWLDGMPAAADLIADLTEFARSLAGFLAALRRIDATDGPPAGQHNFHRGAQLADGQFALLAAAKGQFDQVLEVSIEDADGPLQGDLVVIEHLSPRFAPGNVRTIRAHPPAVPGAAPARSAPHLTDNTNPHETFLPAPIPANFDLSWQIL